jgi:uncharacterized protein
MSEIFDAIEAGDFERVKTQVQEQPDVLEERNDAGVVPAVWAHYEEQHEIAGWLREQLDRPLDLWEAAAFGDDGRVREVLEAAPGEVDSFSPDGFTPLHLASFFGHEEIARYLLERGADVTAVARNELLVTPLHSATAEDRHDVAVALVQAGAPVNATMEKRYTPIQNAAMAGNVDTIRLLLDAGADPTYKMEYDKNAIDFAREKGHPEAAEVLEAAAGQPV